MVFLDNGLVFSIEQRYGLLLVTREMLVFPHLIIINILSVQIAFFTPSLGLVIWLNQTYIHKQLLCLRGYAVRKTVSTIFLTYHHWNLILSLSDIVLKTSFVVCGKIKSTANLDILQFWCGFCVIESATIAFSLVDIRLTTLIESGHFYFITLCFVHDFRVFLWARGKFLCLHVECNFHVVLILQSFVLTYFILIKSGLWFFLLWLRLDQIVLFLFLTPKIHAKHLAKHILIVQHIWGRFTYDKFRCLLIHFALALFLRLFWSVNFGLHNSDLSFIKL